MSPVVLQEGTIRENSESSRECRDPATERKVKIGLLTGGQDPHYAFGLAMALVATGIGVEVIGGDSEDLPEMRATPGLRFLNLYGNRQGVGAIRKIQTLALSYARLMRYAAATEAKTLHILWNNRFEVFDRTLLMLYYKLLGKKVVFTAHNVNAGRRDSKDSWLNRVTLEMQYRLADHIFVHTEKMKKELFDQFHIDERAVTVIPYGLNNAVPDTDLTSRQARERLGIRDGERAILFFGAIKTYKGLEHLVAAFQRLASTDQRYRLIIAGERKKGCEEYFRKIEMAIEHDESRSRIIQRIEFIKDQETELYFKAADVAVLPYTEIFQSGILFLTYSFGLPAIATDVGSFRDDIVEGKTGFICKACDPDDLAATIQRYFESDLFQHLEQRRLEIRDFARSRHSWEVVGNMTRDVYSGLLAR